MGTSSNSAPVLSPARFNEPLPAVFAPAMRAAGVMNGTTPGRPGATGTKLVQPGAGADLHTAHNMAHFAHDLGCVDAAGLVLPPFIWNEDERRARLATLDALLFHLYGISARDSAHILDSLPIVPVQDEKSPGHFRTRDNILAGLTFLERDRPTCTTRPHRLAMPVLLTTHKGTRR